MSRPSIAFATADPLRRWRRLAPRRVALVDRVHGDRLSYETLDARVDRWARALRATGIGFRDVVATLSRNRVELIALYFACARVGATLAPLSPALSADALARRLAGARPRLVFGEAALRADAEAAVRSLAGPAPRWLDLDGDVPAWLRRGAAGEAGPAGGVDAGAGGGAGTGAGGGADARRGAAADAPVHAEDAALLLHADAPDAGALLPHRQILFNALATCASWELGPGDVGPIVSSLAYTAAWNVLATPLWHAGGTVVLFDDYDPDAFLVAAVEERITVALLAPEQLAALPARPLWGRPGGMRFFLPERCPASVRTEARAAGCGVREIWGRTECGPNCFAVSDADAASGPGVLGWPVAFLEARVVDAAGRDAAPGEPGELRVRGAQVFGGYVRDPQRTRAAVDAGGWLRTGETAWRDEAGAFFMAGGARELHTQMLAAGAWRPTPGGRPRATSPVP